MKRFLLAALMVALSCGKLSAGCAEADSTRRWAISTNICDWAMLGTMNMTASLALGNRATVMAGIKYNPFTFFKGEERQFCFRQITPFTGGR